MAIKLTGDWKKFKFILDPKGFSKRLRGELNRANTRIANRAIRQMKSDIRGKKFIDNAALTKSVKGSSVPLVDNSDMINAFTFKKLQARATNSLWFVGLIRASKPTETNIGITLHQGVTIAVTPKMRAFFAVMAAEHPDQGWKQLKPGTTKIIIKPRPFITRTFARKDLREFARQEWSAGVQRALNPSASAV